MVKRSLQACVVGIKQAKRSFSLKGWTQDNLVGEPIVYDRLSVIV